MSAFESLRILARVAISVDVVGPPFVFSCSYLRIVLLGSMATLLAASHGTAAAEPTRLDLAREAAAAIRAAGEVEDEVRSRVAGALFAEGACEEADAVFRFVPEPRLLYNQTSSARRCLDPLVRSWASLRPSNREEAVRLHAAGAYLRRSGRLAEGEAAIRRAWLSLAVRPDRSDVEYEKLVGDFERLLTLLGSIPDSDLWRARVDELVIYEGTPLAAARLAEYLPAAQRAQHGLVEAEDMARFAYAAGRPDLARAYLGLLSQRLVSGTRDEVRALLFAEHNETDLVAALLPTLALEAWPSVLWADKGALAAKMIDSEAISKMPVPDQANALAELCSALLFHGDRTRAELAADRTSAVLRAGSTAPLGKRKRLTYMLAEPGRTAAVLDLVTGAPLDERADIGREALHGALSGGQIALFDLVRASCACALDVERIRFGLGPAAWLSPSQLSQRFTRLAALIAAAPGFDRASALRHTISSLMTPSEWRVARSLVDAERNPAVRSNLLVGLGHAMVNAGRIGDAAVIAETAHALPLASPQHTYDVAWLLHRVGRTTRALTIARSLEPQKKIELLAQMAAQSDET